MSSRPWSAQDDAALTAAIASEQNLDEIAAALQRDINDVMERVSVLTGQILPFPKDIAAS